METAGKCLEWVKDHLALDEIGIYLDKHDVCENQESIYTSLYDYMTKTISKIKPGAGGVIFTPWLHGNRCPFEDPNAAGMFFNIRLETGKTEMIRAVLEGVCYHLKWMLECQDRKIQTSKTIRFSERRRSRASALGSFRTWRMSHHIFRRQRHLHRTTARRKPICITTACSGNCMMPTGNCSQKLMEEGEGHDAGK